MTYYRPNCDKCGKPFEFLRTRSVFCPICKKRIERSNQKILKFSGKKQGYHHAHT